MTTLSHPHRPRRPMIVMLSALLLSFGGCSGEDEDARIIAPDLPRGEGRIYAVGQVSFNTVDGLTVAGIYGRAGGASRPTVILVHDVGNSLGGQEWLANEFFETLLESGYNTLTVDLRGHGGTPLPSDGRAVRQLLLSDLDNFYLDVRAAITWLRMQPGVDAGRLAIIGTGGGGNVAFVAMGAFPDDLKAGVALSPGLWDAAEAPLVIGGGMNPFTPHSMLFLVGETDVLPASDSLSFSYAQFARSLASLTQDPKSLTVVAGVSAHGLELLAAQSLAEVVLDWLAARL